MPLQFNSHQTNCYNSRQNFAYCHTLNPILSLLTYRLEPTNLIHNSSNLSYIWGLSSINPIKSFGHKNSTHPWCSASATASSIYPQELPLKLVRKNLNLEFIEMTELVPDVWRAEELDYQCCSSSQSNCIPRRGPVTNILLWLERY